MTSEAIGGGGRELGVWPVVEGEHGEERWYPAGNDSSSFSATSIRYRLTSSKLRFVGMTTTGIGGLGVWNSMFTSPVTIASKPSPCASDCSFPLVAPAHPKVRTCSNLCSGLIPPRTLPTRSGRHSSTNTWDTPTRVPVKQAIPPRMSGVERNTSSGCGSTFDCSRMASTPSNRRRHYRTVRAVHTGPYVDARITLGQSGGRHAIPPPHQLHSVPSRPPAGMRRRARARPSCPARDGHGRSLCAFGALHWTFRRHGIKSRPANNASSFRRRFHEQGTTHPRPSGVHRRPPGAPSSAPRPRPAAPAPGIRGRGRYRSPEADTRSPTARSPGAPPRRGR